MRESSLSSIYERRCVLLNQLSSALGGWVVALWRVARGGLAMTEAIKRRSTSRPPATCSRDVWARFARPKAFHQSAALIFSLIWRTSPT